MLTYIYILLYCFLQFFPFSRILKNSLSTVKGLFNSLILQ